MPRAVRLLLPILTAFAASTATPAVAATPGPAGLYDQLAGLEARVAAIGFRLTTANAAWCTAQQPQFGWIWGDPRLYDESRRPAALAAYAAPDADTPYLAAVAPDSPAARADLHRGTPVFAIDGIPVPPADDADPFARIAVLETQAAALRVDAPAALTIADGRHAAVVPVAGCVSDFRVEAADRPAGGADGRLVRISAGLASFATDDAELAAAVAHELAHNILRHPARLDAAGVDRGLFKELGRSARLFRQTEAEADRLSVWLLAGAGYDPEAAARFWRKFGGRKGRPLFPALTHPGWRDRVASVEREAAAIAAARAAGEPLHPPLIDDMSPLE